MNVNNNRKMHAQTGKKVFVTLFLVFVRLPIYCACTQFLKNISSSILVYHFCEHS